MSKEYHLSHQDYQLVREPELFYAKHRIVAKVYSLFGDLSVTYARLNNSFPSDVTTVSPKIYKGENYRLLPYVMLDYPRFFKPGEAFAIRSLFWWGKHFSIHLVLGGKYKRAFEPEIFRAIRAENLEGWHIAITNDPWQHHFEEDNYLPIERFSDENNSADYLKLGKLLPLDKWEEADDFFMNAFTQIASMINYASLRTQQEGS